MGRQGKRDAGASAPPLPAQEREEMDKEILERHQKALEALRSCAAMYEDPVIDQRIIELTLASKKLMESGMDPSDE